MELNVASEQDIRYELARRKMVRANARIKDRIMEITVAYNTGKISDIEIIKEDKSTTGIPEIKYVVYMK